MSEKQCANSQCGHKESFHDFPRFDFCSEDGCYCQKFEPLVGMVVRRRYIFTKDELLEAAEVADRLFGPYDYEMTREEDRLQTITRVAKWLRNAGSEYSGD